MMLKTAQQIRNVITIFHNPHIKASQDLVKLATSRMSEANTDQLDLQIEEGNPTPDQLNALRGMTPLLSNVKSPDSLPRPTLVSWFNGKVAVNNDERAMAILNIAERKSE